MEALETVVFERTPQGAVAIKSTGDEVPRRLRTLLLAVDGRSPVAQYVPFLTAFAPLSEKFAELEQLGYLRRKGNVTAGAVDRFERAQSSGPAAQLPRIDASSPESGFMPWNESDLNAIAHSTVVQSGGGAMAAPSVANAFELELQALARQMGHAGAPVLSAVPATTTAVSLSGISTAHSKPTLADILQEMERFLSRSAGLDGLPVAIMLEQIKSLPQLGSELPAYLELVKPYGADAEAHVERLAGLLDRAM